MIGEKTELSRYPRFFLNQIIFRTIYWIVFLPFFIIVGKECVDIDILGKVWNSIFDKKRSFNQYFLGSNNEEKVKLINYALYFIFVIIILNLFSVMINRYLWKKDKYIENNNFYLYNWWVFMINTLTHIACAFLLTLSFVSLFNVIFALIFITFNNWEFFPQKRKLRNPQIESFFSWKNQYIRKILIYSTIVIFIIPFIIGYYQVFHKEAMEGSPEGFAKVYQELINSSDVIKKIVDLIIKANYSLFHWFVLIWSFRAIISDRMKEFGDFWTKIDIIQKKLNSFKHYYYYQESLAISSNSLINLGDYSYLKNIPNFLVKDYLESNFSVRDFAIKTSQVVKYIEFCEDKIKDPTKKNYLNYCLFNEFNSWEDCLRTKRLISRIQNRRS